LPWNVVGLVAAISLNDKAASTFFCIHGIKGSSFASAVLSISSDTISHTATERDDTVCELKASVIASNVFMGEQLPGFGAALLGNHFSLGNEAS
jgi:hypothetical protein